MLTKINRQHSLFLYHLRAPDTSPALHKIKTEWEAELGITISDDRWAEVLEEIKDLLILCKISTHTIQNSS